MFRTQQANAWSADLLGGSRARLRRMGRNGVATMQHVEAPELMAAYALDALPETESRPLATHIRTCPACQRDLAQLLSAVSVLPLTLEPVAPPLDLRQRLMDRAMPARAPQRHLARHARVPLLLRRSLGGWMATAALFLASLGLAGWGLSEHHQLGANPAVALAATSNGEGALGSFGLAVGKRPTITVSRLAAPPTGKVYEAWVIHSGIPRPAGIFVTSVDGTGGVVLTTRPVAGDKLDVTLEPAPGGLTPTGPALLEGSPSA